MKAWTEIATLIVEGLRKPIGEDEPKWLTHIAQKPSCRSLASSVSPKFSTNSEKQNAYCLLKCLDPASPQAGTESVQNYAN